MSIFVSMTVLVQTGTKSTLVLVFITVQGTISVTYSKQGAGGAITQGVCLQVWHARTVWPASETARTAAASQLGRRLMVIYLQGGLAAILWGSRFENALAEEGR